MIIINVIVIVILFASALVFLLREVGGWRQDTAQAVDDKSKHRSVEPAVTKTRVRHCLSMLWDPQWISCSP